MIYHYTQYWSSQSLVLKGRWNWSSILCMDKLVFMKNFFFLLLFFHQTFFFEISSFLKGRWLLRLLISKKKVWWTKRKRKNFFWQFFYARNWTSSTCAKCKRVDLYTRPFNLHLDFWKPRSWKIKVCFKTYENWVFSRSPPRKKTRFIPWARHTWAV